MLWVRIPLYRNKLGDLLIISGHYFIPVFTGWKTFKKTGCALSHKGFWATKRAWFISYLVGNYVICQLAIRSFRAKTDTYRSGLKLILRSVNVKHRSEFNEQPPPGPASNAHKLSNILLDATNRNVLNLRKKINVFNFNLLILNEYMTSARNCML